MKSTKTIFYLFILVLTISCGSSPFGGTEAGNPSMRSVLGQLPSPAGNITTPSNILLQASDCPADTVIAVNSLAEAFEAETDGECRFALSLPVNASYAVHFVLDDEFVAAMIFNNSTTSISSSTFILSDGETDINLGLISLNGQSAFPQSQPAEQNDTDDDGIFDFDDDDFRIEDCDLDGHYDDFDELDDDCDSENEIGDDSADESDDSGNSSSASILDVYPESNDTNIDIEESIEVLFGCAINTDTVDSTSFAVTGGSDPVTCEFSSSTSDQIIECQPQDSLEAGTSYTVQLNGIECESGTPTPETVWTFTTGLE